MSLSPLRANAAPHPHRRYGLIGPNGCGKSCMLKALAARDVPIPPHIDVYLLDKEIEASDMTALEAVMAVDEEKVREGPGRRPGGSWDAVSRRRAPPAVAPSCQRSEDSPRRRRPGARNASVSCTSSSDAPH